MTAAAAVYFGITLLLKVPAAADVVHLFREKLGLKTQ
jgi:hypothetical protein